MKKIFYYLFWLLVFCFILSILAVGMDRVFVLFSAPKIISISPSDKTLDVPLQSFLVINFDKPVKRQEIQLSISPEVYGEWKFRNPLYKNHLFRTLIFEPAIDFEPDTQYQVEIKNIKGFGFNKVSPFQFTFRTTKTSLPENRNEKISEDKTDVVLEPKVTMIDIPMDWQDYALSCEAASLKMALASKGIFVSEDEIMKEIGYDETEHRGDIWGNPYEKYVGDIDGKICQTGYGVYWEPVANAGDKWRPSESFSGGTLDFLLNEIKLGNPVVVWGVLPVDSLHDCSWYTKEGEYVKAFKETHVRLVIGFIGPPNNPSKIIINDPLAGRLYWSTAYFLENWKVFNNSGLVIR